MALDDWYSNVLFLLRWVHILAGITWIGHLYFFNFVNLPFQGVLEKELKPRVNPFLVHRALWWFRWGAMTTFVVGWLLFLLKYGHGGLLTDPATGGITDRAIWILFGGTLGTVMWFNVWFIIWPAQKQLLAWTKSAQSPPEMAPLAKKAALASRINTYLSGPMLFGMIAPNNYGSFNLVSLIVVIALGLGTVWGLYKVSPKVGNPLG
jgi:uncharacterized membrane protein